MVLAFDRERNAVVALHNASAGGTTHYDDRLVARVGRVFGERRWVRLLAAYAALNVLAPILVALAPRALELWAMGGGVVVVGLLYRRISRRAAANRATVLAGRKAVDAVIAAALAERPMDAGAAPDADGAPGPDAAAPPVPPPRDPCPDGGAVDGRSVDPDPSPPPVGPAADAGDRRPGRRAARRRSRLAPAGRPAARAASGGTDDGAGGGVRNGARTAAEPVPEAAPEPFRRPRRDGQELPWKGAS